MKKEPKPDLKCVTLMFNPDTGGGRHVASAIITRARQFTAPIPGMAASDRSTSISARW